MPTATVGSTAIEFAHTSIDHVRKPDVAESIDVLVLRHVAHPLPTELDEERDGSVEVVDDDADAGHPLDPPWRSVPSLIAHSPAGPLVSWRQSRRHVFDAESARCS